MDTNSISPETARRIALMRFPLCCAVVLIHARSFGVSWYPSTIDSGWAWAAQWTLSEIVARLAVPFFFLHAGFLFYAGGEGRPLVAKLRSRAISLLWPYLLWNAIVALGQIGGQLLPGAGDAFAPGALSLQDLTPIRLADLFIGFDQGIANGPLWFLRDLMVLSLLAPALRWVLAATGGLFLAAPLAVWFGAFGPIMTGFPLSAESVVFYSIGILMTTRPFPLERLEACLKKAKERTGWLLVPYAGLAVAELAGLAAERDLYVVHKVNYFFGMLIAWQLAGLVPSNGRVFGFLMRMAPASFFIYLAHGGVLAGAKEFCYAALRPDSPARLFAAYLLAALSTVALLAAAYFFLRRRSPPVLAFATGRNPSRPAPSAGK